MCNTICEVSWTEIRIGNVRWAKPCVWVYMIFFSPNCSIYLVLKLLTNDGSSVNVQMKNVASLIVNFGSWQLALREFRFCGFWFGLVSFSRKSHTIFYFFNIICHLIFLFKNISETRLCLCPQVKTYSFGPNW
jgi:hypothetical protein